MSFDKASEVPLTTMGDRLNYSYILSKAILNFITTITKREGDYSAQEVQEASNGLRSLILNSWIDKEFIEAIKNAEKVKYMDIRRTFCGRRVGPIVPKKGIGVRKVIRVNPYVQAQACINLLDRQGKLEKRIFAEIIEGLHLKQEIDESEDVSDQYE